MSILQSAGSDEGDSAAPAALTHTQDVEIHQVSQSRLIWRRFRRHKLAMLGAIVTLGLYLVAAFAEFLAPFPTGAYSAEFTYAPPQPLRVLHESDEGMQFGLHVNGYTSEVDSETWERVYTVDDTIRHPVRFFARGYSYEVLGLFETDRHLFGPSDPEAPMYLFGADRQGRDVFSRLIYGTRISMTIGLIGVALSLIIGIILGGLSGYFGGRIDSFIQRIIEVLVSLPSIPLWMALAAALPRTWSPIQVYFGITVILSVLGWTTLARVVRGRFISLREEDFVMAARLDRASPMRIIMRHMVPSFASHIIASTTLAIPGMIIAETSLSFLGLGLQPPIVSWGVLLQEAQNIRSIATAPWLLIFPGGIVVIAVLCLNFVGDGLRDAADPYGG